MKNIIRFVIYAFLVSSFIIRNETKSFGWGTTGHQWILEHAVAILPASASAFYKNNSRSISEHVMDPDQRKKDDRDEATKHYIDLEDYFDAGLSEDSFPWTRKMVEDSGVDWDSSGQLPWTIVDTYKQLVEALKKGDKDLAIQLAADLAHYVADAHQPLHTTSNHDGQETGNDGIHSRFESNLVDAHIEEISSVKSKVEKITDPLSYTFSQLKDTHELVEEIMTADDNSVVDHPKYDNEYYNDMWEELQPVVTQSLKGGAKALASYYYSAVIEAQSSPITVKTSNKAKKPAIRKK